MFSIRCNSCVKLWTNKKDRPRIKKIQTFINKYNWEGTEQQSEKDDRKKMRKIT